MRFQNLSNCQRAELSAIFVFVLIVIMVFSFAYTAKPAYAHITKKFGDLTLELGWNVEPALTGQMNAAQLTVFTGSANKPQYVVNAVANLDITLKYGTVTKKLEFLPSPTTEGQYLTPIIPTKEGTYSVIFKGTIQGQSIDTQINLDDVASSDTINFPTSSSGGSNNPGIISQLGRIINQLTNDIDSAKTSANTAAQNAADAQKAVQDAKSAADRAYLVGMTGIGVGAAGIAIAVVSMNRRESKLLEE